MNSKLIGIVLVIIGVSLIWWGYDIYDAASSQITRALSGDTPIEAWIGMVGGVVCLVVGILKVR